MSLRTLKVVERIGHILIKTATQWATNDEEFSFGNHASGGGRAMLLVWLGRAHERREAMPKV